MRQNEVDLYVEELECGLEAAYAAINQIGRELVKYKKEYKKIYEQGFEDGKKDCLIKLKEGFAKVAKEYCLDEIVAQRFVDIAFERYLNIKPPETES